MLPEQLTSTIAQSAYEAVRAWDTNHGEKDIPAWDDADDAVKASMVVRVNATLTDPRAGDATLHNKWVAAQKEEGWSYGKTFDEKRKVDPLVTPFHLLPSQFQNRERCFRAVILSLSHV